MGTRCGDVDAGILMFLSRSEGLTISQVEDLLNRQSGLLGLSGISSDMREILKGADEGQPRAKRAVEVYCYRVRKYLGAYAAALGGLDAVIFTGGIGEGSAEIRSRVLRRLNCLGITLNEQRNRAGLGGAEACRISTDDSKVAVLIVRADEERMIAREALHALNNSIRAPEHKSPIRSASQRSPLNKRTTAS
jgi:acetate kinase